MARRIATSKIGGLSSRSIRSEAILGRHIHDDLFSGKYVYEPCNRQPVVVGPDGYSPPSGVDTESFLAKFPNGGELLGTYVGTGTQLAPLLAAGRFAITLDEVAGDGVEYNLVTENGATAYGPLVMTRALGPRMFFRAKLTIIDVSEILHCAIGVRAPAAVEADIDDYEDFAALDVNNGTVNTLTNSNAAGAVTTDTLEDIVDGQEFELMVKVDDDFKVSFFLDGAEVGAPFTFHGDPTQAQFFLRVMQEGAGSVVNMSEFEAGPLFHVHDDPDRR